MPLLHKKNQFIWLTIAMVGLMITGAVTREVPPNWALQLLEFVSVALLLLSLLSLRSHRKWTKGFLILVGVILATVVMRNTTQVQNLEYFYLGLLLIFMLGAAWQVGRQVLFTGEVNFNVIVGSMVLYMMIGYIFSIIYTILLEFRPMALNGIEVEAWYDNLATTNYFSFVTLTTLGYGDISPATPLTQVIVIIEAVIGMFYIAAIVASLVGSINFKKK